MAAAARARGAVGAATEASASTAASADIGRGTARRRRRSGRCSPTSTRRRRCCEDRILHVVFRGRLLGINKPWCVCRAASHRAGCVRACESVGSSASSSPGLVRRRGASVSCRTMQGNGLVEQCKPHRKQTPWKESYHGERVK